MEFWEILVLAFVLGLDALSVALAVGTRGTTLQLFAFSYPELVRWDVKQYTYYIPETAHNKFAKN